MTEQYNLKPCPLCGSIARMDIDTSAEYNTRHWTFGVVCTNPVCGARGEYHDSAEEAKTLWNYHAKVNMTKSYETVNHPSHYNTLPVECIDVVEHLNFCTGNAIKYAWRAGLKPGADKVQDLQKSIWYLQREIQRIESFEKQGEQEKP